MADMQLVLECYFDEAGYFCVDPYEADEWLPTIRVHKDKMDGFSFHAAGKLFTISSTPESFSVMPTVIRLPSEAYD